VGDENFQTVTKKSSPLETKRETDRSAKTWLQFCSYYAFPELFIENPFRYLHEEAPSACNYLNGFSQNISETEKSLQNCTQRLRSAKRKFVFVIFVSCQQGDFEQDFQFWTLARPKNVNYIITISINWFEIPVQKTMGATHFTASDVLEIRQISSPFLVPSGPSPERRGEHEKMHEKWGYYSGNEIKAWISKGIVTNFFLEDFFGVSKYFWTVFS
jgi:hypothetical protein